MKDFLTQLLGSHTASFHLAGLIFCIIGMVITKWHFWKKHKAQCEATDSCEHLKFNFWYWIKDNIDEVVIGLITSYIFVRFLDQLIHIINEQVLSAYNFNIPNTEDQVFYYLVAAIFIQYWIHTKYRKNI